MGFQELRSDLMILAEAIEFSKQFPRCHPKIFKGFVVGSSYISGTDSYIVLSDSILANESCYSQMEDYIKSHNLRLERVKDYLVICTLI
jgi:hypothetical protein